MPKWMKLVFMQTKLAIMALKEEKILKMSKDDKKLITEIKNLLDTLDD